MLKHELEEPGYFANKNVRVFTSDGREVNPRTVNWKQVKDGGSFPYRLKQDAGPENALGPMKLDFQNDHAVFIHGTSAPKLFAKQDRFFSSGCVRVDDPLGLATFLLQDDPTLEPRARRRGGERRQDHLRQAGAADPAAHRLYDGLGGRAGRRELPQRRL